MAERRASAKGLASAQRPKLLSATMTIDEVAAELRTSPRTVRRMISRGVLPAHRVKGTDLVRIRQEDVLHVLKPVVPGVDWAEEPEQARA